MQYDHGARFHSVFGNLNAGAYKYAQCVDSGQSSRWLTVSKVFSCYGYCLSLSVILRTQHDESFPFHGCERSEFPGFSFQLARICLMLVEDELNEPESGG